MPYLDGLWSSEIEAYYKGDVQEFEDGSVQALALVGAIAEQETVSEIEKCEYKEVPGNHITMMFGENAKQVVAAVTEFLEA